MKLDDGQHSSLLKHLSEKWKRPANCSVCGSNDWAVAKEVYELREFHGGNLVAGGSSIIPVSPVACKICGNTVLINPLIAGIKL